MAAHGLNCGVIKNITLPTIAMPVRTPRVTISLVLGFLFSNDHTKIPIAATIISMDTM